MLVWICRFSLPPGVWKGLWFVIVALPGLFSYLCFNQEILLLFYLSLILALQRSNETFKYIKHPSKCVKPVQGKFDFSFYTSTGSSHGNYLFLVFQFTHSKWRFILPLDQTVSFITDTSYLTSESLFDDLGNHLSILHVNIQSLYPKMDLVKCEAQSYDILVFS